MTAELMDPARMQPYTDTTAATLSPTTCGEHLATVHIVPRRSPVLSVSDGSGLPTCRLGLDQKNSLDQFQNRPDKWSAASKRSKPGCGPVEPRVSPGLARPVRSDLRVCVSGFSIYGRIQISYCSLHTIDYGTALSFCDVLTTFI